MKERTYKILLKDVVECDHAFGNDEGREAMARIQGRKQAPDSAKSLAGMIANFNHMLSEEDKATLAQLFP